MATSRERAKILTNEDRNLRFNLINLRLESGMSEHDLAELLGVKAIWVRQFEEMGYDPRLSAIRRYAHALGVVIRHTISEE